MIHPFTDTYIAMARAAKEIETAGPTIHDIQPGDAFWTDGGLYIVGTHESARPTVLLSWVPRLDQLLGMLGNTYDFARALRSLPYEETYVEATGECRDWHELALAAVMREKHGKVWRDGAWVKG